MRALTAARITSSCTARGSIWALPLAAGDDWVIVAGVATQRQQGTGSRCEPISDGRSRYGAPSRTWMADGVVSILRTQLSGISSLQTTPSGAST
jgi:hypothetical protein